MDNDSITLPLRQGSEGEYATKGRCRSCWGTLLGRSGANREVTGIKCQVCGRRIEYNDAYQEDQRMSKEAIFNCLNVGLGGYPKYQDGLFLKKVFPHIDRLTREELGGRLKANMKRSSTRSKRKILTRAGFPIGSPAWLVVQAKMLMAGVEDVSNPHEHAVIDFPEFDVNDDGSITVHLGMEELGEGSQQRKRRTERMMGATMIEAMISAFSCELIMKAICLTYKDVAFRTHDLCDLFSDLPEESQRRLTSDYEEIEEVMVKGRQTFGAWRYFEGDVGRKGILSMIHMSQARALAKAARVLLDEAEIAGLYGKVNMNARQNVRVVRGNREVDYTMNIELTGGEIPPRT